jgi:GT2 family glycosyltransferase/glycosyltransferase involved in cell wall biosynthesis
LDDALKSILRQTYRTIEIVLVDAIGNLQISLPEKCEDIEIRVVGAGTKLTRPMAANLGLEESRGEYLMFLDEDDWIAPNHISELVTVLERQTRYRAAYSSAQKTSSQGTKLDYMFAEKFQPLLLMRDNYIPIHAMVFSCSLVSEGCRFDEQFEIYEDWDFWLQLSQKTEFLHLDQVSAFYREGGLSQTAALEHSSRFSEGSMLCEARVKILNKWISRWNGRQLNALMGDMDQSERIKYLNDKIDDEHKAKLYHQEQLKIRLTEIQSLHDELSNSKLTIESLKESQENLLMDFKKANLEVDKLNEELVQATESYKNLERQARDYQARINLLEYQNTQLERAHRLIEDSIFWRITSPARKLRLFLKIPFRKKIVEQDVDSKNQNSLALNSSPLSRNDADGASLQDQYKDNYKESAAIELKRFLESGSKLDFYQGNNCELSIVLVLFNQAPLTLMCLKSLLKNSDIKFDLVIVDNNSTDETPALLEKLQGVEIIRNSENMGFVKAVNQASRVVQSPYMLLLNNDALIESGALSNAMNSIKADRSVGAVGAKIKLLDGSLQEAGSIIWSDGTCIGYGRGCDPNDACYQYARYVDYCSGAFLLVRHDLFQSLGGFDEDFAPAYYEETDFCIRLRERGFKVLYQPRSEIIHYEFASSGGYAAASELLLANRKKFISKHASFLKAQFENGPDNILPARNANRFPNILVVDDRVPYPSLGSGYPRSAQLLGELSQLDINISFLPLNFPSDDWDTVYQDVPDSIEVLLDIGREGLSSFLDERRGYYNFILVSRDHNMDYFNSIIRSKPGLIDGVQIVYDAEAVAAPREIMRRRLLGEVVSESDERKAIKAELNLAKDADRVIAVSEREAKYFRECGFKNVSVLGHQLFIKEHLEDLNERNGLLFVGALRDEGSPNVDSLNWFVNFVLPLIESEIPNIGLTVVGDNSAPSLRHLRKNNIVFTGRLESIDCLYSKSRVFIAPTRFAAGIPHKVHEAASHGIPCVVTSLLASQLGWKNESELLVADQPQLFAQHCIKLLKDDRLWMEIRNKALQSVRVDCSAQKFRDAVRRAILN